MYKDFLKPCFDRIMAFFAIIITSPLLIIISLIIIILNKSNPFFIQERPGKNEKIFKLIKFKTMDDSKDSSGQYLADHLRINRFGNFLRKSSMDELPELANILFGQMSFVGPRPLLIEYLPLYSDEQKKRHECKPGITGLAQISGRNLLSWEEKFQQDIKYVEAISFKNDIVILIKTFGVLFKTSHVNQSNNVTMEKFKGNH